MTTHLKPMNWSHVTAHHEAGHAIAAIALGLTFINVELISDDKMKFTRQLLWPRKFWDELRIDKNNPYVVSLVERRIHRLGWSGGTTSLTKSWDHWSSDGDRKYADYCLQHLIGGSLVPNDPLHARTISLPG